MTTGKRALIVDDSRSARVILSRMLEQHGLDVDTAESAEQALEHLSHQRPDVIFMDHLMPGMDGFQAVRAIKNDPQTASIPLMMYTSQEGELYVSQARALGAVGVLPKTVRPVDVARVLYQLHLLPDRRQNRTALFDAQAAARAQAAAQAPALSVATSEASTVVTSRAAESAGDRRQSPAAWEIPAAALSELQGNVRQSTQQVLKDQFAEQRRFILATFEAFARRVGGDLREAVAKAPAPPVVEPPPPSPPQPPPRWPVIVTALLAALPAAILGLLYLKSVEMNASLGRELAEARADAAADAARLESLEGLAAAQRPASVASAGAAGPAARTASAGLPPSSTVPAQATPPRPAGPMAVEYVPYGETPLANARLDRLRGLAATLEAQHYRGRIVVDSFVGDFCLSGSAGEGYALADPALPAQKCDVVGNPFEDALSPAQRQSVAFANFAASLRKRTGGAIVIETVSGGRHEPAGLPGPRNDGTAGQWNAGAAQQNRVEFRLSPAA